MNIPILKFFLRRIQPQTIAENERRVVNEYITKLTVSRRYIVDIWKKDITICESNEDIDALKEIFGAEPPKGFSVEDAIDFTISFTPVLRFTLENTENRTFAVKCFRFLGAVYEWRHIDEPDSLENLAKKYVAYLGKDAFFTLL